MELAGTSDQSQYLSSADWSSVAHEFTYGCEIAYD